LIKPLAAPNLVSAIDKPFLEVLGDGLALLLQMGVDEGAQVRFRDRRVVANAEVIGILLL